MPRDGGSWIIRYSALPTLDPRPSTTACSSGKLPQGAHDLTTMRASRRRTSSEDDPCPGRYSTSTLRGQGRLGSRARSRSAPGSIGGAIRWCSRSVVAAGGCAGRLTPRRRAGPPDCRYPSDRFPEFGPPSALVPSGSPVRFKSRVRLRLAVSENAPRPMHGAEATDDPTGADQAHQPDRAAR